MTHIGNWGFNVLYLGDSHIHIIRKSQHIDLYMYVKYCIIRGNLMITDGCAMYKFNDSKIFRY